MSANGHDGSNGGVSGGGANGTKKKGLPTIAVDPVEGLSPLADLPASEKVYLEDGDLRVPVRRITVDGGRIFR